MTEDQLRSITYVVLGMILGVVIVALFIDFHKSSSKELPAKEEPNTPKESKSDESNTQGA